jgi:U3 small nucleolar RNA-associated protein 22
MFLHPTDDYDFVIQLNPKVLPRYLHNVNLDIKHLHEQKKYANNKQQDKKNVVVLPGFDPARSLFDDLKVCYVLSFFFSFFFPDRFFLL